MSGDESAAKARALQLVLDAWDKALSEEIDPDLIASVAMYATLADMVDRYGADTVAEFCASLPERVRNNEFTLRATDA